MSSAAFPSEVAPAVAVLERARDLGFLGPGPVGDHVAHALGFAAAIGQEPRCIVDLGSGGGIPALVLVSLFPAASFHLIEAMEKRARFLHHWVTKLDVGDRVHVLGVRAEVAARTALRGSADVVTARSFAPPAVTAECAAGFLAIGGRLIVSDPPESDEQRWPEDGLATVGFSAATPSHQGGFAFATMTKRTEDDRWPRRAGIPAKRPCWRTYPQT